MKSINRLLIIVLAAFAISCGSDNPVTPSNGIDDNRGGNGGNGGNIPVEGVFDFTNFMPINFIEYILESDGTEKPVFAGKMVFDKTKKILNLGGAIGYEIDKKYNKTGNYTPDDEDFVYIAHKGGKQFFIDEDVINSMVELMSPKDIDLPFELPDDTYYLLLDLDAPINQAKVIAEFPYQDDDLNPYIAVKGKIILEMTRKGDQKFNYKGNDINVQAVTASITFDGSYLLKGRNIPSPTPTKITINMNFLVHHKMGIVKQWVPFNVIKLAEGIEFPLNGYQFKIK